MISMQEYIHLSDRTAPTSDMMPAQSQRAADLNSLEILHGAIGLATESGEILDVMKKHIYYGKPIDTVNLAEEIGDVLWYVSLLLRNMGMTYEQVAQMNINKLQKRFPDQFTEDLALNRDLKTERAQLEADSSHLVGE